MKRWIRLASCFYPASWRKRYAAEFDAMLEQVDAGWNDLLDTLKGAFTMQLTSWNLKTIVLACGLIGLAIAAAIAFIAPNEYASTAVMRLSGDASLSNAEKDVLSRTSLQQTILRLGLYKTQRMDTPMESIVEYMRMHDLSIKMANLSADLNGPRAFMVGFTYPDRKLAQAVTQDLVAKFTAALPRAGTLASLEVLDPPSWPQWPSSPRRDLIIFTGLFLGLLVGLSVSYALRWRIVIERRPAR